MATETPPSVGRAALPLHPLGIPTMQVRGVGRRREESRTSEEGNTQHLHGIERGEWTLTRWEQDVMNLTRKAVPAVSSLAQGHHCRHLAEALEAGPRLG